MSKWNDKAKDSTKKKVKDPDAPKRPITSYLYFCQEQRPVLKKECPDLKGSQITSELSVRWNALSEKEKQKYVESALVDRNRYATEMQKYRGDSSTKKEGPKRPRNSYMYFIEANRVKVSKNKNLKGKELTTELGRMWKELSAERKSEYEKLAATDKLRYEREKNSVAEPLETVKEEKQSESEDSSESSAKSTTKTFKACSKQMRKTLMEKHPKWKEEKLEQEIKKRWNALSDSERENF